MALPWFFRKLFGDTGNNGKIVDDVIPDTVVKTSAQTLDATKQSQARTNIDAVSDSELKTALSELITEYGGTVPTESQSL